MMFQKNTVSPTFLPGKKTAFLLIFLPIPVASTPGPSACVGTASARERCLGEGSREVDRIFQVHFSLESVGKCVRNRNGNGGQKAMNKEPGEMYWILGNT